MPLKICPLCQKKSGVRTKLCSCGHDFKASLKPTTEAHKMSMGSWVNKMPKTMKAQVVPPPMESDDNLLSNDEVKDEISNEGLGFCIYSYLPVAKLRDVKLRKLWVGARMAMQHVVEYLWDV